MMAAGYRIGLPIAFGSDAIHDLPGHTRGSQTLLWIDSYVAAGLPPSAILRGLTGNAARLLVSTMSVARSARDSQPISSPCWTIRSRTSRRSSG